MASPKNQYHRSGELRSFGRRKGRKLSARQRHLVDHLLPGLSLAIGSRVPDSINALFGNDGETAWLEIGFGGGEHLIWQGEQNRDINLIGCEPFIDGVVKVLSAIQDRGITNIRLFPDDARDLLRWLPATSIGRAFILFPDPWPKKKHLKRRLVNAKTLDLLARVMKPGAELRISTDIADYARAILLAVHAHQSFDWPATGPDDWRRRRDDWPATRYEQKARREGRRCYYFRFRRVAGSAPVDA